MNSPLDPLAREWQRQLLTRDLLFALAAGNAALAVAVWQPLLWRWQLPWCASLGVLLAGLVVDRPWQVNAARVAQHLDRTHPALEESASLALRPPGELTLLERLQLRRVEQLLTANRGREPADAPFGAPARDLLQLATLCLAAAGMVAAVSGFLGGTRPSSLIRPRTDQSAPSEPAPKKSLFTSPPKMTGNRFTIIPPAYTGHPLRNVEGLAAEVEEGSTVTWTFTVDAILHDARLTAGSISLALTPSADGTFAATTLLQDSGLFSLTARLSDGTAWNPPELFSLKVTKDQPPVVDLLQPAVPRTEIMPPATAPVAVEAVISDDYAVVNAHLVATVAKGSGEAVKFREQILPFDACVSTGTSGTQRFTRNLDLTALGLEAGDELYFFVEARDNRRPDPNRTRSETRFIVLRGPDAKQTSVGRGVAGINLIPQYFRSERQLILDTEKLVADRPTLPDAGFRARANDLGQDQALLRLRYGRFLGEDQEDSPLTDHQETSSNPFQAPPPERPAGPRAAASIAARFAQEHVQQDREGGGEDGPPRPFADGAPLTAAQIRQPFVDTHDLHDKNTFFDHGTQGTMRDALSAMWEAEKFLRTARPQEALAPEHRALDILKDLQQSERAYVQHVGFDAPPIKVAERRLKGDTADVPSRGTLPGDRPASAPAERDVHALLLEVSLPAPLSPGMLARVEETLTVAATRDPNLFLPGLQALRRLRENGALPLEERLALQRALLRSLPPVNALPARAPEAAPELASSYYKALQEKEAQP